MADETDKYIVTPTGTRLVEPSRWFTTVDPSTVYVSGPGGLLLGPVEGAEDNRTVFVGYPYSFPKDDYRGV